MIEKSHGNEADNNAALESAADLNAPDGTDTESLSNEFERLAAEWKEQGKYLSSPTAIADLPAYRAIVAMGTRALPLILGDLQKEPNLWFTALKRITGQSPVPEADRGKIDRMAEAWLRWGREHGLIA